MTYGTVPTSYAGQTGHGGMRSPTESQLFTKYTSTAIWTVPTKSRFRGDPCVMRWPARTGMTEYSEINDELFDELDNFKQLPIDVVPTPYHTWNHMCRDDGG